MKVWWPFLLALAVVLVLVGCYLMGWATATWLIAGALIAFPLLYAGAVILLHVMGKG